MIPRKFFGVVLGWTGLVCTVGVSSAWGEGLRGEVQLDLAVSPSGSHESKETHIADSGFFVEARISSATAVEVDGETRIRIAGTVDAERFKHARIELGKGENPSSFSSATQTLREAVRDGSLAELDLALFEGSNKWVIRVITEHENGRTREARFNLTLG